MNSKARKRKAIEAEIVRTVNDVENVETLTKVFVYNGLNVHKTQLEVWGEEKSGTPYTVEGYELTLDKNSLTARKRLGERIAGKIYELSPEQVEATEKRYKRLKKVSTVNDIVLFVEA